ncbi:MAG: hypothetical protein CMC82_02085 [Flavobacteriaceae bacterium]|nr:hypothetical protein [Flavobacteriaceae bacterium]|tara:strand:- start:1729 stop:2511 length:783 start_codon:yes stop_codon:yes gene_type:complete
MLLSDVVIGSTVDAAYYALVNECYFVPTRKTPLLFYESLDLPILMTDTVSKAWVKINLILGLLSKKIITSENCSIRVIDNQLKISRDNTVFKYNFEKLYIFDPTGISLENKIKKAKLKTFTVIDDFELSVLGPKRYELPNIERDSDFVKKLYFYSSDRVDGSNFITDCIVESELTQDQLNNFDYSDTMVKFAVKKYLESIGIHGRFMKYYASGKPKYRKPNVTHVKRLVFEKDNNVYEDTDQVKFTNMTIGEIIEESSKR